MLEPTNALSCGVCGGVEFTDRRVLWPDLVTEWQLSPAEAAYVDRQQGATCNRCGSNLRSIALANAIRACFAEEGALKDIAERAPPISILEINQAGDLSPILSRFEGRVLAAYPEVDIHCLPYADGSFDLVVHSDTLEHVINPIFALTECRRVLKPGGGLCFTVPIIVGRMTRSRAGLPMSYHGGPGTRADDYAVRTEFGADAWTLLMDAGFAAVTIHAVAYPAATAFLAIRS
jgi:SAM-dependent methyltransferase